jgi:ATP-dependent Clp protease adaptor protein ClpS
VSACCPLTRGACSNVNKRDYVVKCLLKCIEGMTHERAFEIMDEADMHGLALVKVEAQEEAEEHCEKLRGNGLISSVEPAD